jgi:hypothetical protein
MASTGWTFVLQYGDTAQFGNNPVTGEQKETKETENNGEGFEFAVRGISIPQLF